jgi:hypothetical protein
MKGLRRFIRETIRQDKNYFKSYNTDTHEWTSSPDWAALEASLLSMGRNDVASYLDVGHALGGSFTLGKIQAALDNNDNEALDNILASLQRQERKQSKPKYGRY